MTSGRPAEAGRLAVAETREAGMPVTYKRGDQIVCEYPDGREEILAVLPSVTVTVPPGVRRPGYSRSVNPTRSAVIWPWIDCRCNPTPSRSPERGRPAFWRRSCATSSATRSLALHQRAVTTRSSIRAYLFDNSGQGHRLVAEFLDGNLVATAATLPAWYAKVFPA